MYILSLYPYLFENSPFLAEFYQTVVHLTADPCLICSPSLLLKLFESLQLSPISVNNLIFSICLVLKFANFSISQMAANMMKFAIKDNQEFEIDVEVAKQNDLICDMLEVCSESIDYIYYMILEINVFKLFILHSIMLLFYNWILWVLSVRMVKGLDWHASCPRFNSWVGKQMYALVSLYRRRLISKCIEKVVLLYESWVNFNKYLYDIGCFDITEKERIRKRNRTYAHAHENVCM